MALVRGRVAEGGLEVCLFIPLLRKGHGRQGLRQEGMMDILGAELDEMARGRHVVEVQFAAPIPDAREVVNVEVIPVLGSVKIGPLAPHPAVQSHPVAIVGNRRVGEQLTGEYMVPTQGNHVVSPSEAHFRAVEAVGIRIGSLVDRVFHVHLVPSVVGGQEKTVRVGQAPSELSVQVIEEVVGIDLAFVGHPLPQIPDDRIEEERMQAAGAEGVAELVPEDGSFQMELFRQDAQADAAMGLFHVAVVRADIHDRGHAPPVTGRERAFIQGHFLHRLRLENG